MHDKEDRTHFHRYTSARHEEHEKSINVAGNFSTSQGKKLPELFINGQKSSLDLLTIETS